MKEGGMTVFFFFLFYFFFSFFSFLFFSYLFKNHSLTNFPTDPSIPINRWPIEKALLPPFYAREIWVTERDNVESNKLIVDNFIQPLALLPPSPDTNLANIQVNLSLFSSPALSSFSLFHLITFLHIFL